MSLAKAFFTISGLTLVSRVLGFIRDIMIAALMGAGPLVEVFLVAFKLPNFFRRLFAEGAFNAAFSPMFTGELAEHGKASAKDFAERIFSIMFFTLLAFVILMEICMPWLIYALSPGFVGDEYKLGLAVELTRITFPYLFFISLVSLFGGMLNGLRKFAAVAATPILLNLCLISALLFLPDYTKTHAHALSYGVAIAGVVQFLWLYFACKRAGIVLRLRMPVFNDKVRAFFRRMTPGIIGAGIVQINLWIDIIIATFIPGAIAYLYYADRINQLPLSIIGTAMGAALLPMLSRTISNGDIAKSIEKQNRALEIVLFFALPATAAIIVIAYPLISVLFQRGAFGEAEALATSYALIAYAIGLPAYVMAKIFSTTFFANKDTKTPVKIAGWCLLLNLIFNIAFVFGFPYIGLMPHIGLALATAFSSWLNVILLTRILIKEGKFTMLAPLKKRLVKVILSALIMSGILMLTMTYLSGMLAAGESSRIIALIILIASGAGTYFTSVAKLKAFPPGNLLEALKRKKG